MQNPNVSKTLPFETLEKSVSKVQKTTLHTSQK